MSIFAQNKIYLGLCCINNELRNPIKNRDKSLKPVYCSRTCIRNTYNVEKAKELALLNLSDLEPIFKWNNEKGINHYRCSSDMFPRFTDTEVESYTLEFAKEKLKYMGDLSKNLQQRLTFHPGQHVQVAANTPQVFEHACKELEHHAQIFDLMGIDDNGILCVHGGAIYNDKEATKRRWIEQFDDLPSNVKKRICIENCEKCYSVRDCLDIAEQCKIPVIFDNLHYNCYCYLHPNEYIEPEDELLDEVVDTWKNRIPVLHLAQQADMKYYKVGKHADYVENIPQYILDLPDKYNIPISLEVEAKQKESAIMKLKSKYNI